MFANEHPFHYHFFSFDYAGISGNFDVIYLPVFRYFSAFKLVLLSVLVSITWHWMHMYKVQYGT